MDNNSKLERIEDLKNGIAEAERMKVWKTWEELNDELELLEEEIEIEAKLKIAQKNWDELSFKQKKLYPKRPESIEDVQIIRPE